MHRIVPLLALLLLAAPAAGQVAQSYTLEPSSEGWTHVHVVSVEGNASYEVQQGLTLAEGDATLDGTTVTIEADGPTNVTLRFQGPGSITIPDIGPALLTVHAGDAEVTGPSEPTATDDGTYTFQAQPGQTYTVATQSGVTTTVTHTVRGETPAFDWTTLVLGLLAGILLWAFLVQRGMVQRRSRKQVVSAAAHTTAAAEGPQMLEARRRTLMAAMKELEKARMNKEVPDDVYDRLKADLKKQTVTVLRALDAAKE